MTTQRVLATEVHEPSRAPADPHEARLPVYRYQFFLARVLVHLLLDPVLELGRRVSANLRKQ
jgi:hypothetical protein